MRTHAMVRAMERYGLEMTVFDLLRLEWLIGEGSPLAVKLATKTGDDAWLYAVRFKGIWLPVVWRHRQIRTVLPSKELKPHKQRLAEHLAGMEPQWKTA